MNVLVWVLQIVLALFFIGAGVFKTVQSKEKLRKNLAWVDDYSANGVRAIGAVEILGGLGLVLPAWTGIAPVLTPLAAVGLVIVMIGATVTHAKRSETPQAIVNVVVVLLLAVIVWARFGPYSY